MAGEVPEGLAIEPIWVVDATYAPDAPSKRPAVRAEHLARVARLRDEGVIIEAGGYADWSSALLLIRAPSEEAALDIIRADVYWRSGVWSDATARPLGRVVKTGELPKP
jgi:uncharacterized protein